MQDVLANEGVAEAFRSQTVSVTNSQHSSRTYYMVAPSEQERENWVESITKNSQTYAVRNLICAIICSALTDLSDAYKVDLPSFPPQLITVISVHMGPGGSNFVKSDIPCRGVQWCRQIFHCRFNFIASTSNLICTTLNNACVLFRLTGHQNHQSAKLIMNFEQ